VPPLDSFPLLGYCADCHEPQYDCPSGSVCENGHGGAATLDEVPVCRECEKPLGPNVKFCAECGASTAEPEPEPEPEPVEDVKLCPSCDSPINSDSKFCGECGHSLVAEPKPEKAPVEEKPTEPEKTVKVPVKSKKKDEPKKTVKVPVKEKESEEEEEKEEEQFDFSQIDPEQDWECFGVMIEPKHRECRDCPYITKCAKKAGVEL